MLTIKVCHFISTETNVKFIITIQEVAPMSFHHVEKIMLQSLFCFSLMYNTQHANQDTENIAVTIKLFCRN